MEDAHSALKGWGLCRDSTEVWRSIAMPSHRVPDKTRQDVAGVAVGILFVPWVPRFVTTTETCSPVGALRRNSEELPVENSGCRRAEPHAYASAVVYEDVDRVLPIVGRTRARRCECCGQRHHICVVRRTRARWPAPKNSSALAKAIRFATSALRAGASWNEQEKRLLEDLCAAPGGNPRPS